MNPSSEISVKAFTKVENKIGSDAISDETETILVERETDVKPSTKGTESLTKLTSAIEDLEVTDSSKINDKGHWWIITYNVEFINMNYDWYYTESLNIYWILI